MGNRVALKSLPFAASIHFYNGSSSERNDSSRRVRLLALPEEIEYLFDVALL